MQMMMMIMMIKAIQKIQRLKYDKVVALGSQIASKRKKRRKIFKKSESLIDIKTRVNHGLNQRNIYAAY